MSDLSTVVASSIEVEIGDQTYKMRPLTLADLGEFENWVRQKIIINAMFAAHDMEPRDKRGLVQEAINASSRVTYDAPEAQGMMQSIEGAGQLIYLSLHHEHKDITREQVIGKLANVQQFSGLANSLMKMSAPTLKGGNSPKVAGAASPQPSTSSSLS